MSVVDGQSGGVFFLHGYGGTDKTFMWTTLAAALRSQSKIVLTVATSGIASLLLPGGRTAHSKFKKLVPAKENSTCIIDGNNDLTKLLKVANLIIWDEAPMAHRYCFEALDRTLKDIMPGTSDEGKTFGGKVIVFGGDFRQILPVIPRGNRSDIVHASISSSYIWDSCHVLTLTKNMRLQNNSEESDPNELKTFSKWILKVGEEKISEPNDGFADFEIPDELLINDFDDPIDAIVKSTYPNLLNMYNNPVYLQQTTILASTIDVVDTIDDYVLSILLGIGNTMFFNYIHSCFNNIQYNFIYCIHVGQEKEYFSFDSIDKSEINDECQPFKLLALEFLSTLRTSGLPNNKIKLKVGTTIMLLRNLDQVQGLGNGTRLIVTRMADHVLEARIISGKNVGNLTYIPRMSMSPSQSPWPFKYIRRQFLIIVSYAMTINKSQGQTLDSVGLYLPKSVFSHG